MDWLRPPLLAKISKNPQFFMITPFWNRWDPPPFVKKIPKKSQFFSDKEILDSARPPSPPFGVFLKKKNSLFFLMPPLIVMMCYYISSRQPLFEIFTQSIDAIDVKSVTLSRLNSINAIDVTRCWLMLIECSNVSMFQCSKGKMVPCATCIWFKFQNTFLQILIIKPTRSSSWRKEKLFLLWVANSLIRPCLHRFLTHFKYSPGLHSFKKSPFLVGSV